MKATMKSAWRFEGHKTFYVTCFESAGDWGFTVENENAIVLNCDFGYESEDDALHSAVYVCCTDKITRLDCN